jgi:hypothetical protein
MFKAYPIFNLIANIYFKLQVLIYNNREVLIYKYTPFNKIPYYYFNTIIKINPLSILVFFLALYLKSNYKHPTYLSEED